MEARSDAQMFSRLGVMTPRNRNIYARARTFCHIIERKQTKLLTMLHAGYGAARSWLRVVIANLLWIATIEPKLASLQFAEAHTWVAYLNSNL